MATPAPCDSDADCPDGVRCEGTDGDASSGFCDVQETLVSTGGSTSLGAPAPCSSDADCGESRCVIATGEATGYCDVAEMLAP